MADAIRRKCEAWKQEDAPGGARTCVTSKIWSVYVCVGVGVCV